MLTAGLTDIVRGKTDILDIASPDTAVIVYCGGAECDDSGRLYDLLIEMGYGQVRIFEGGMAQWRQAHTDRIVVVTER